MSRNKSLVGSFIIVACLIYLIASSFEQATSIHLTLNTLNRMVSKDNVLADRIQLGGSTVVPGSIKWDKYKSKATFDIADELDTLEVAYIGNALLPDTFKDSALVVLEGNYNVSSNKFEADLVFAKCPSKYEGQDYDDHVKAMQ